MKFVTHYLHDVKVYTLSTGCEGVCQIHQDVHDLCALGLEIICKLACLTCEACVPNYSFTNQPAQLNIENACSKWGYNTFQKAKNKGTDQTEQM